MGKKSGSKSDKKSATTTLPFLAKSTDVAFDPTLSSLFDQSAGPVQAPSYLHVREFLSEQKAKRRPHAHENEDEDEEDLSEDSAATGDDDDAGDVSMNDPEDEEKPQEETHSIHQDANRKRKRASKEDDHLEDAYLSKLAEREVKDKEAKKVDAKRRKVVAPLGQDEDSSSHESDSDEADNAEQDDQSGSDAVALDSEDDSSPPPVHESVSKVDEKAALDRSRRTVFLSNVSIEAIRSKSAKKTLTAHLSSFLSSLPKADVPHKLESLRFRSVAFSDASLPKRAAYAKKEIMDSTTQSTNAYVVYTTEIAARKAPTLLNGTIVLDRHIRVDSVAHPAPVDHKRCVFVGNLAFVDKENTNDSDDEKKKRKKKDVPPADVEEGLWRTFNEHCKTEDSGDAHANSPVESVRVIRDRNTRIGKGFAYVQFYNPNAVEAALTLDGKKFPPLLPRNLRVSRAKNVAKKSNAREAPLAKGRGAQQQATLHGRAKRLLGRAGASKLQEQGTGGADGGKVFVFEGHRASEKGGDKLKLKVKSRGAKGKGKGKTGGKPKNRSAQRAAAYKAKMGGK
ncbi:Nucleolar protein 12 [Ascosphaera pollenicola]|nr:Nucleolar protein 12 [Ascosphaera pollenicola]